MTNPVSSQLRQKREERQISLEVASKETHIRLHFLQALEDGDFGALPSHIQVRGFLRSYANYLGLDSANLLSSLQQNLASEPEEQPELLPEPLVEVDVDQGEAIFQEIGLALEDRRELLGLSTEDVSQHTRIPEHYIGYLEKGEMKRFPSPTQARGMLGNYVGFLDLEPDRFLLRYAEGLQAEFVARQPVVETHPVDEPPEPRQFRLPLWFRNVFTADILLGGVVLVGLLAFIVWGIGRVVDIQASQIPEPTAPSLANVLLPSNTPPPTETSTPAAEEGVEAIPAEDLIAGGETTGEDGQPVEIFPDSGTEGVQVYVVVRQRAYMRVTIDGEVNFDGRVIPGSAYPFSGQEQIEILTGNGAAFQVSLNGEDLGSLGAFGEVVSLVFTSTGVAVPTATASPTIDPLLPTPTETPTPTIPPTATLIPTATPAP
ncbi:MAG: DUF4115 domain-containing protein [Chloroflexi bacterium]|nr:DUF4115 domain-containing protein [Chloroflexota bacterium]